MKNTKLAKALQSLKKSITDQRGQGTAEYVLLLAIVAGILIMFGPQIKQAVTDKMNQVTGQMSQIGQ